MSQFPHIKVVDASAGSGKTWQLAQRYIHLLYKSDFRNILAITFTNKAANEMKSRILEWLKKSALGDEQTINDIKLSDKHDIGLTTNISEKEFKDRANAEIDKILRDYLNFNVRTIDSFINSIAASSSFDLKLPARYDITFDPKPYIKYVIDLMLSRIGSGKTEESALFDDFLYSYLSFEEGKSWKPKEKIQENIDSLRKEENIRGKKYRPEGIKTPNIKPILKLLEEEKAKISNKRALTALDKAIENEDLTKLEKWQDELSATLRTKIDDYFYASASSRFDSYINIFDKARQELDEIKNRKRIIFIDELSVKINEFLSAEGIVPEIYFMLGDFIAHYLVDEFQDTNKIQWENLKPLIEESLSKGGSLFYVGDKKQALYRFRGGEVELFDIGCNSFASAPPPNIEILGQNWRSRETIVDFNNRIFGKDNLLKLEGITEKHLDIYKNCSQKIERAQGFEGGFVSVKKIEGKNNDEIEDNLYENIIPLIESVSERRDYSDITILTVTNKEVRLVTEWLIDKGYPVASDITLDLRQNRLISEIINFLRFLNSPKENLYFASFISGDIFAGVSGIPKKTIFGFLEKYREKKEFLYMLFRDEYKTQWEKFIEPFFSRVGYLPLYDLVFEIMQEYKVLEKFYSGESFFMRLLELIKEREQKQEIMLMQFLEFWDTEEEEAFQIVLPAHINAIKILTIHKAKGLSFPVAIVLFMLREKNRLEFTSETDTGLSLKYITKTKNYPFSERLREIYDEEDEKALLDDLNSLYVGLTRAEDEMHLFIPTKNYFSSLFVEEEIGKLGTKEKKKEISRETGSALAIKSGWNNKIARKKIDMELLSDGKRKKMIERGNFIHYIFAGIEKMDDKTEKILQERISACAKEFGYNEDLAEINKVLSKILSLPEVKELFAEKGLNEKDIVSAEAEEGKTNLRVDRLVITKEKIFVVDYKTGEESSDKAKKEHLKQIKKYIETLESVYEGREIEGRIVYIDEGKVLLL